jgi:hypothetical protein
MVHIVDSNNNPVSGAYVSIAYGNGLPGAHGTSTAGGNVTFLPQPDGVPATITVIAPDNSQVTLNVAGFSSGDNPPIVITVS